MLLGDNCGTANPLLPYWKPVNIRVCATQPCSLGFSLGISLGSHHTVSREQSSVTTFRSDPLRTPLGPPFRYSFSIQPLSFFPTAVLTLCYVTQVFEHVASILTTVDPRPGMSIGDSHELSLMLHIICNRPCYTRYYLVLLPTYCPLCEVFFPHVSFPLLFSGKTE